MTHNIKHWYGISPIASSGSTLEQYLMDTSKSKCDIKIISDLDSFENIYLPNLCREFTCINPTNVIEIYDDEISSNLNKYVCREEDESRLNGVFFDLIFRSFLDLSITAKNTTKPLKLFLHDLNYDVSSLDTTHLVTKSKITLDVHKKQRVYVKQCLSFLRTYIMNIIRKLLKPTQCLSILHESITNESIDYKKLQKYDDLHFLFIELYMTSPDKDLQTTVSAYAKRRADLMKQKIISMQVQEKPDILLLKTIINRTNAFLHFLKYLVTTRKKHNVTVYYAVRYKSKTILFTITTTAIKNILSKDVLEHKLLRSIDTIDQIVDIGEQWGIHEQSKLMQIRISEKDMIKNVLMDLKTMFHHKTLKFTKRKGYIEI